MGKEAEGEFSGTQFSLDHAFDGLHLSKLDRDRLISSLRDDLSKGFPIPTPECRSKSPRESKK